MNKTLQAQDTQRETFCVAFKLSYTIPVTPEHDVLKAFNDGARLICENLKDTHGVEWIMLGIEAYNYSIPSPGRWRCKITFSVQRRAGVWWLSHGIDSWGRSALHDATVQTLDAICEQAEHYGGAVQALPDSVETWRD